MSSKVLIAALNDFNGNQQKVGIIEECVCARVGMCGGRGVVGRRRGGQRGREGRCLMCKQPDRPAHMESK